MRKVLILAPRLDCSFKEGYVPPVEGPPNHPLRTHYLSFYGQLLRRHEELGDSVTFEKKALWQFDPSDYKRSDYDIIYVPHKQKYQFDLGDKGRYYMQQVIPSIFSIDREGWGADLSIKPTRCKDNGAFDLLKGRITSNKSKFDQPDYKQDFKERDYVFFPCQLPHDETIKYHSDISVYNALLNTLEWAKRKNVKVWVKGHPANPASMIDFQTLTLQYDNAVWTTSMSIHQLIENSLFVALVNSGVGIEALLHGKIVAAYGRADYTTDNPNVFTVRDNSTLSDIKDYIHLKRMNHRCDKESFKEFIQGWYNHYYDVTDVKSFSKIL